MTDDATLDDLVDADSATERFRAAGLTLTNAEPDQIRHKQGETTVIAYRFTLPDGDHTWGYAHWCVRSERAGEIHSKAMTLRPRPSPIGTTVHRLDRRTVLFGFPNDMRLRTLRWYVDPRKLKRSLADLVGPAERISGGRSRVEILRYKPERRVVARVELTTVDGTSRPLLLRYGTRREAGRLAAIATHLREHGTATPEPIAQLDGDRVAVDRFIDGEPMRDVIRTVGADGAELGAALVRFHTTPAPRALERRTIGTELDKARAGLAGLAAWAPALTGAATALADLLARSRPDDPRAEVLLHGDLHSNNLLVHRDAISFVDLERVAVGPAAVDLGYFRAHAIALSIRRPGWSPTALGHADAMIERYRMLAGPIADRALAWHAAIGLVDQALLVTRHLEGNWSHTGAELLAAARGQLDAGARALSVATR